MPTLQLKFIVKVSMTKEEAFKNWRYNNPITYDSRPQLHEAWEAACEWQKEEDAVLVENYDDEQLTEDIAWKIRHG